MEPDGREAVRSLVHRARSCRVQWRVAAPADSHERQASVPVTPQRHRHRSLHVSHGRHPVRCAVVQRGGFNVRFHADRKAEHLFTCSVIVWLSRSVKSFFNPLMRFSFGLHVFLFLKIDLWDVLMYSVRESFARHMCVDLTCLLLSSWCLLMNGAS